MKFFGGELAEHFHDLQKCVMKFIEKSRDEVHLKPAKRFGVQGMEVTACEWKRSEPRIKRQDCG